LKALEGGNRVEIVSDSDVCISNRSQRPRVQEEPEKVVGADAQGRRCGQKGTDINNLKPEARGAPSSKEESGWGGEVC